MADKKVYGWNRPNRPLLGLGGVVNAVGFGTGGDGGVGVDGEADGVGEGAPAGEGFIDRGRFEAAVDHAVATFFVAIGAVVIPVGGVHKFLEGFDVAFAQ